MTPKESQTQNGKFWINFAPYEIAHVTTYKICPLCSDNDSVEMGEEKKAEDCFNFEVIGFNNPPEFTSSFNSEVLAYDETMRIGLPGYEDIDLLDIF